MTHHFRVFATCDIGEALDRLRTRGYEVEVYPHLEVPPKSLIIDRVRSGIDGLIMTLRDPIDDAEVFEAGKGTLKVVAQIAVGFDNINRADANRYPIPFTHSADVLTEATALGQHLARAGGSALARALKQKRIAGAALDVHDKEPLPPDSPLRDPAIEDRCRLIPHFASAATSAPLSRSRMRHGEPLCAGPYRRAQKKLRREHQKDVLGGK